MANKTTNYGLTKPLETDFYDVNVQNENMNIIDTELKKKYGSDNKPTPAEIGAPTVAEMNQAIASIPTPDVSGQINTHNSSTSAHSDIRKIANDAASVANAALPKSGGTMSGALIVESSIGSKQNATNRQARMISHNNAAKEADFQNYGSDTNYVSLRIATEGTSITDVMKLTRMLNGDFSTYRILHEGNSPAVVATAELV